MDVHEITEGEGEGAANVVVIQKLERLRENLRSIGRVAFKIDDVLHCLNHCSGVLQRSKAAVGKLRQGLGDDLGENVENIFGLLDTYDGQTEQANASIQQQIQYLCNDSSIDESCSRLADIGVGLVHFADAISEPRQHQQVVDDIKRVCDTAETIHALVGGTSTRSSSSRAKAGSREGIPSFFQPSGARTRNTRSNNTGVQKRYTEQLSDSDSEFAYKLHKKVNSGRKSKAESDEEYNPYEFHDDYQPIPQPSEKMRSLDFKLSARGGTIDTGSQEDEMDFDENKSVQELINTTRPRVSSSHSKTKMRAIKYSQDDADSIDAVEVKSSEVAKPKVAHQPGKTRSLFKVVETSVSAKKAPSATATAAVSDHVIHIDDENSNEAISIADTEAEWTAAAANANANAKHSQDQTFEDGSQEGSMVKTSEWQAIPHGDEKHFIDHDDRDDFMYQSQTEPPLEQEETSFHSAESNDSDGSAEEEEEVAKYRSSRGTSKGIKNGMPSGDVPEKNKSLHAAVVHRASNKDSPATSAAFAHMSATQTPNRNHIREDKLPTPCTGVSIATAFSAEPKYKTSWPDMTVLTHQQEQVQGEDPERDSLKGKVRTSTFADTGTGTQSDSEGSTAQTQTHREYKTTHNFQPEAATRTEPEAEAGVSRARTGPGHAAHRHHHHAPAQPPAANMLGNLSALDARFPYTEPSPPRTAEMPDESQEWLETKSPNGKRPRERSEEQIEEGRKLLKKVQSDEVRNHRRIVEPPVIPSVDPVPPTTRTRQRESTEHAIHAQSNDNFVDLTEF